MVRRGQNPGKNYPFATLINAYALGDKLLDSDFKDAVTDAMVLCFTIMTTNETIVPHPGDRTKLYDKTAPSSKARRLLVHRMARIVNPELYGEVDCHTFLLDVAQEAIRRDSKSTEEAAALCEFHEHAPGAENCYRTKYA